MIQVCLLWNIKAITWVTIGRQINTLVPFHWVMIGN